MVYVKDTGVPIGNTVSPFALLPLSLKLLANYSNCTSIHPPYASVSRSSLFIVCRKKLSLSISPSDCEACLAAVLAI